MQLDEGRVIGGRRADSAAQDVVALRCECGGGGCRRRVLLTLDQYDVARSWGTGLIIHECHSAAVSADHWRRPRLEPFAFAPGGDGFEPPSACA